MIENISPATWNTRAPVTQIKKIDMGNCYMILMSGIQPPANESKVVVTDDIAEQTRLVFDEIKESLSLAGGGRIHWIM